MNTTKILYCFMTVIMTTVFSLALTSCGDDDDTPAQNGDTPPATLMGTWYTYEDMTVTFRDNNTGEIKMINPEENIPFSYIYNASTNSITLSAYGETEVWKIVSLTGNTLVMEDSEGEELFMYKPSGTGNTDDTDCPDPDDSSGTGGLDKEIGPKELLYGMWGNAGIIRYEFTEDGFFNAYYLDEETGQYRYTSHHFTYDENTHKITFIEDPQDNLPILLGEVTLLTKDLIQIKRGEDGASYYLSRINKDEKDTIGDISMLYCKKLTAIGVATVEGESVGISLTLKSNGQYTLSFGGSVSGTYTYDASNHILKLSTPYDETTYKITRLTSDVIFMYDLEQGKEEIMEFRAI